jgi:hypothetical protein
LVYVVVVVVVVIIIIIMLTQFYAVTNGMILVVYASLFSPANISRNFESEFIERKKHYKQYMSQFMIQ